MSLMQLWGRRTGWCYFLHQVEVGFSVLKAQARRFQYRALVSESKFFNVFSKTIWTGTIGVFLVNFESISRAV